MRVYHGTDTRIDKPRILVPNRALDFGPGFYTTSDLGQARRWARGVARRRSGRPLVHEYLCDDAALANLRTMHFEAPSREWLDFIADHRLGRYAGAEFDYVAGPVANDRTIPVIQQYLQAEDKEAFAPAALALIKPENLVDQRVFKTARALALLELVEVSPVEPG
jgi:hypothetical protein